MRRPTHVAIIAALVLVVSVSAGLSADARLATSRANYQKRLAAIEAKYGGKEANWPAQFERELRALERTMRGAGDLDGLLAVRKELSRFAGVGKVTDDDLVADPLLLRELQMKYTDVAGEVAIEKSKAVLELVEKYVAYMENLKVELTKAGDLDGAIGARDEIKRVKASDAVAAAEFDIAALQADKPVEDAFPRPASVAAEHRAPAARPPDGRAPAQPKAAPAPPVAGAAPAPTAPAGYTVYPAGERPPRVMGEAFTPLALKRTGNTSMSDRKVSVSALRCTKMSGTRGTTRTTTVRLRVRANRTGPALESQTVNIRFFTKPSTVRGRVVPTMVSSGDITLPTLTSEGIYIDCAGVSTTRSSGWGTDFYGIVVSVYSDRDALSFQGMSTTGLKDQAAAAMKRTAVPVVNGEGRWRRKHNG